jgi:DNA-binding SARP family transcriptional activator
VTVAARPDQAPSPEGLVRSRLIAHLDAALAGGVALVVAPAGFGKTTLLEQYARTHHGPVARYRADPADAATDRTARRVTVAIRAALDLPALSDEAAVDADPLAEMSVANVTDLLLLIDNVDCLIGTPGELIIERLLANRPSGVRIVIAGRRMPALNLMRHEVSGRPDVLGSEHLRFRTWEVERLLAGVYAEPLPPDEVALLTRRTGGWAAGLTMFHLSTRGRPLSVRRRAVAALSGRWAVARDYLARNLLAGLSDGIRDFLVRTCVFDVLTGERCDRLLDTEGSDQRLDELAHRYGLPITVDGGHTYQYHQVLRSHLGAALVEELGEAEARRWHARAAELLVAEGAYAEAVRSYARAGDWPAVRRLLARVGGDVVDSGDRSWDDLLPGWLVAEDPWLVYAEARRRLGHGQLATAIDGFRQAETLFGDTEGRQRCLRERRVAAIWLTDEQPARTHWSSWLRAATRRHPTVVAGEAIALSGAEGELVRLIAELLAGNVGEALRHPRGDDGRTEVTPAALALRLLRAGLRLAAGDAEQSRDERFGRQYNHHRRTGADPHLDVELDQIAEEAESVGAPWLSRLARATRALGPDPDSVLDAYAAATECERRGDRWGYVLATALACLHEQRYGKPDPRRLVRLVAECRELGAGVLQAWAQAFLALAAAADGLPDADVEARAAATLAASAGVPGVHVAATVALARLDPERRAGLLREAEALAASVGLPGSVVRGWAGPEEPAEPALVLAAEPSRPVELAGPIEPAWPGPHPQPAQPVHAAHAAQPAQPVHGAQAARPTNPAAEPVPAANQPVPSVSIRCFGGFRMEIAGQPVDTTTVRAKARAALRLLAMHAGRVVHREVLIDSLWPGLPPDSATRNLQVTISTLRGLLEPGSLRGKQQLLVRTGDAYGIAVPEDGYADTLEFSTAVQRWNQVRHSGNRPAELAALRAALGAYGGELLPEDGPESWAVELRERFRRQATRVAGALAAAELAEGNAAQAIAAAEYCVTSLDPHDDDAWQVLLRAYAQSNAPAKAAEAQRRYAQMLASLGVPPTDGGSKGGGGGGGGWAGRIPGGRLPGADAPRVSRARTPPVPRSPLDARAGLRRPT